VRRLLSSPRRRRRLLWSALVALLAVGAAVVGLFYSNTGDKLEAPFTKGPVQRVAPPPKSVAFTEKIKRDVGVVAAEFVATGVLRTHTERSYDLTDRAFHQGISRKAWANANPIVPFPKEAVAVVKWRLDYSFRDRVGLKVSLQPRPTAKVGAMVFNIELHKVGAPGHRRWLVDYWAPAGLEAPAPAQSAAGQPLGPAKAPKAGLGAAWLFIPIGVVFGTILLVPIVLIVRGWRRRVRADRAYSAATTRYY
jgi:hypothetical protein